MRQFSDEERLQNAAGSLRNPVSRRAFLKLAAAAGASLTVPSILAACGGDEGTDAGGAPGDAATGSTASGGATTAVDVKTGTLAEQIHTLENDYFVNWDRGFKQAVGGLDCEYRLLLHDGDSTKQLGQIESYKQGGGTMLIGNVATEGVLPAVAKACQQNSIYYSNVWDIPAWFTPLDVGDYYVMYQTPPSEQIGYEMAKLLFEAIGGEGKVVHIAGLLGASADTQRTAGLKRALDEFPGIELVGGQPGNWNRIDARKVMLNMVTAHPDVKGVYAQNDSEAAGVLSVLSERGMSDVKVIGIDGNEEALVKIAQGGQYIGTHLTVPGYQAGWAAVNVFDALNGWKPEVPERMMYTGSILITSDNAKEAYEKVYESGELPYDWALMSRTLNPDAWDPQNEIKPIRPEEHWKGVQKERGLNEAYGEANFDEIEQLYAEHYKQGPFKAL